MIVSMDTFQEIMGQILQIREEGLLREGLSQEEIDEMSEVFPRAPSAMRLLVRMAEHTSLADRERVMNGIRNFITDDITIVFDTPSLLETTQYVEHVWCTPTHHALITCMR